MTSLIDFMRRISIVLLLGFAIGILFFSAKFLVTEDVEDYMSLATHDYSSTLTKVELPLTIYE
ncbi:hypothetical protein JCM19046_2468 [Bacillus sp. JCM 19046]|nr:hypothetical protein JCM19045_1299 [Bacillus sp. JCM 19045]GAF17931.1 hypothetical protein JCM19046_2468 [Bacillus sp. JCM 19046]